MPGKALFTSPVFQRHPSARTLGPVKEGIPVVDFSQAEDVNGRSPTAAL